MADATALGGGPVDRCHREGAELLCRWSEPQRVYHTAQHLTEVFTALALLASSGALDPDGARVARIAGWYHDAVYDPGAAPGQNEAHSADLARDRLTGLGVGAAVVQQVVGLIMMTADHQDDGPAGATAAASRHIGVREAFHDADLWILAAPDQRFDEYCDQVRREYWQVPEPVFAVARARVLSGLVGGPGEQVYRTTLGQQEWQHRARRNVARELARLNG